MTPKRQVGELVLNNEFLDKHRRSDYVNQKFATSRSAIQAPRSATATRERAGKSKRSRVLTALMNNSRLSYHPKVFYGTNKFKL